jgi:GNAT superfamily N-acetyltransferase
MRLAVRWYEQQSKVIHPRFSIFGGGQTRGEPMADMLVKLYNLPSAEPYIGKLHEQNLYIRQARPGEQRTIADWVRQRFPEEWAVGCEWAIARDPISCYIAVEQEISFVPTGDPYHLPQEKLVGFACYDAASKGMFGAMGVQEDYRARGVGRALLLISLHAMAAERYAYAIIGWAGSFEFYQKTVGAILIEDSEPGIFRGKLVGEI